LQPIVIEAKPRPKTAAKTKKKKGGVFPPVTKKKKPVKIVHGEWN
jgi:hypothetical protein